MFCGATKGSDQWSDSVKGKDLPAIWTFQKAVSGLTALPVGDGMDDLVVVICWFDGSDSENSLGQASERFKYLCETWLLMTHFE